MTSVLNAELLAFFSIPLAATLMSRGVGYANWLPWQARTKESKESKRSKRSERSKRSKRSKESRYDQCSGVGYAE